MQLSESSHHEASPFGATSGLLSSAGDDRRSGRVRLAHYKGSLVVVKSFRGDVPPAVTQLDKLEMTAVAR